MVNEENSSNKFGITQKEGIYEKYIGGYYIINPIGASDRYVGRIKSIDDKNGKIILNPHFGLRYDKKNGKNLYDLVKEDFDAFVDLKKISFESTTKDSIFHNCYLSNKEGLDKKKESFFVRLNLAYKIIFSK